MKKSIEILILLAVLFSGCRTIQYVPVKETQIVHVKDSVYLRDTLVQYQVEKEYVRDWTGLLDTLEMSTSYASSRAWCDTTRGILAGEIKNRENVINVPVSVKEKVIVKDSIVYKDVPVPVEVEVVKTKHPGYEIYLWVYAFVSLSLLGLWLWRKFRLKV